MELIISNRTIKKDFIFIVLFSSFIPFVISLLPLSFILKNFYEKTEQVNAQRQHTQELEILDSLHKSEGLVYKAIQSVDIREYFGANSDTEAKNKEKLKKYLLNLNNLVPFKNVHWVLFGSRGNILFSTSKNSFIKSVDIRLLNGASYYTNTQEITLSLPLFYYPTNRIYAYISLVIPFSSIQTNHPYLNSIIFIPQDLSALKFKTNFNIPNESNSLIYLIYLYLSLFIVSNLCAAYFGIKLLQDKIVVKLKLLSVRILNEINTASKIRFVNPQENEIDSLSFIFNNYMKYVDFLQYEIEKSSQLAAVGNIAHTIAHDLRKPFSNTVIFIEQIEKMKTLEEKNLFVQEYKPVLKNSIFYVEHLLKEIMEAGVNQIHLSLVKLEDIILKSISNCVNLPQFCEVEFEYKFKFINFLNVDELRIIRIFSNLILNALEAMNFKGKIWIEATASSTLGYLEILIGNNNSYIDPLDIKYLFEPFYTKNKEHGTGLGLSIAQKIIQMHGGSIWCQSSKLDGIEKVEFILTLPLSQEEYCVDTSGLPKLFQKQDKGNSNLGSQQSTHYNTKRELNEKRIIVLDDDPFIGRSWKRIAIDAEVSCFLNPEDLLTQIKSTPHFLNKNSILVSDFNLGVNSKINFYEFVSEVRKYYDGVIFLSTDALDEDLNFDYLNQNKVQRISKNPCLFSDFITVHNHKI